MTYSVVRSSPRQSPQPRRPMQISGCFPGRKCWQSWQAGSRHSARVLDLFSRHAGLNYLTRVELKALSVTTIADEPNSERMPNGERAEPTVIVNLDNMRRARGGIERSSSLFKNAVHRMNNGRMALMRTSGATCSIKDVTDKRRVGCGGCTRRQRDVPADFGDSQVRRGDAQVKRGGRFRLTPVNGRHGVFCTFTSKLIVPFLVICSCVTIANPTYEPVRISSPRPH